MSPFPNVHSLSSQSVRPVAGQFAAERHRLVNLSTSEVAHELIQTHVEIRSINPRARFLVTVSPVPLTATALRPTRRRRVVGKRVRAAGGCCGGSQVGTRDRIF